MKFVIVGIIILAVLMVSGCVSSEPANNITEQPQVYERHVLICPNPDCPLHDPNGYITLSGYGDGQSAFSKVRPIDCEPINDNSKAVSQTTGYHYLCQVCGEEWDREV